MRFGISKVLAAALLSSSMGVASAAATPINLFDAGAGTTASFSGPCYCTNLTAYFTPKISLSPGTYDFGSVREYWILSGPTPDAGMDQQNVYLLFSPLEATGSDSGFGVDNFETVPASLCSPDDAACNALYAGRYQDFDLTYTIPAGQNAIQIALVGDYLYTPPVPEPVSSTLLFSGLAMLVGVARWRGQSK